MRSTIPLKLKILLTLIGLSAVALPIFLIAVDFNPIGYFYQPTPAAKKSDLTTAAAQKPISPSPANLPLLSASEFQALEKDASFLVINLDNTIKKTNSRYLNMNLSELNTLLEEESDIPSLLKTNKLILVVSDIILGEGAAKKLMEKGLQVSIYLYHD